jgi:thioesterase domain-containing protein
MVASDRSEPVSRPELAAIERRLRERIPVVDYLDIALVEAGPERVIAHAPLAPSINHRGTGFGPNVLTVAALATWLRVVLCVEHQGAAVQVVLRSCTFDMRRPAATAFRATCGDAIVWPDLPRGRLSVATTVCAGATEIAHYVGHFVLVAGAREPLFGGRDEAR